MRAPCGGRILKTARIGDYPRKKQSGDAVVNKLHTVQQQENNLRARGGVGFRVVRFGKVFVGFVVVDRCPALCGKKTLARPSEPREVAAIHGKSRFVHAFAGQFELVRALHKTVFFGDFAVAYRSDGFPEFSECAAQRKSARDSVAVGICVTEDGNILCALQHIGYVLQFFVHITRPLREECQVWRADCQSSFRNPRWCRTRSSAPEADVSERGL